MKVAVVGGGIAGLAAAWQLHRHADVTVYEPARLGGRIVTEPFDGRDVDAGPDAFLTRVPDALDLCDEIGIDDLIGPAAGQSLLWWRGRLRTLPAGLVLGVPRELRPLLTSGILSPRGLLRAAGDLVLPATDFGEDLTVRDLVARRFGGQVADRLVDPLVGGIHAGRTDMLSAEATVPQILQAARKSRSLTLGLRQLPVPSGGEGAIFATPRAGLGSMVDRLVARLQTGGVEFVPVAVERASRDRDGWHLDPVGTRADAVVIATSAAIAGRILGPPAEEALGTIQSASVAIALIAGDGIPVREGCNGVLVPRSSGFLTTACSFASSKWPHWVRPGRTMLRVSTGRWGDTRFGELTDEQLVDRISEELSTMLGTAVVPDAWKVHRWRDAFPQYQVGHLDRVRRIDALLGAGHPAVSVCGSSYEGAGIPACIASGRKAARRLLTASMEAA